MITQDNSLVSVSRTHTNSLAAVYKTSCSTIIRVFNVHDIHPSDQLKRKLADAELAQKLCDTYIRVRKFGKLVVLYFDGTFDHNILADALGIKLPIEDGIVTSYDTDGVELINAYIKPRQVHIFKLEGKKWVYVLRADYLNPVFYKLKGDNILVTGRPAWR